MSSALISSQVEGRSEFAYFNKQQIYIFSIYKREHYYIQNVTAGEKNERQN